MTKLGFQFIWDLLMSDNSNVPQYSLLQPPAVIVIAATFSIPYHTILYNINCLIKRSENSRRCFIKYLSSHNCVRVMCYVMYRTLPFYRPIHCTLLYSVKNEYTNGQVGLTLEWSSVSLIFAYREWLYSVVSLSGLGKLWNHFGSTLWWYYII